MDWNQIYAKQGSVQVSPSVFVVDFVKRLIGERVVNVLDYGCGTGRHSLYLAELGFRVVGTDDSSKAIEIARSLALGATNPIFKLAGMKDNLEEPNGFFDAVVASHILQHGLVEEYRHAVMEITRVLKMQGLILVRVPSVSHPVYGKGEEVEPGTFVNVPGIPDGDVPHHYFAEEELRLLFSGFDFLVFDHHIHSADPQSFFPAGLHEWVVVGRKKN